MTLLEVSVRLWCLVSLEGGVLYLPPDSSPARSPSQCPDKMSRYRTRCWLQKSHAARLDTSCGFGRRQDIGTPWRLDGRASTDSSAHDEGQAVSWLCAPHTGTRQRTGTGPHAKIRTWPCGLPRGGPISLDTKVLRKGSHSSCFQKRNVILVENMAATAILKVRNYSHSRVVLPQGHSSVSDWQV